MNNYILGTVIGTVNIGGYYNTIWTRMERNLLIYIDKNKISGLYNMLKTCLWRSLSPPICYEAGNYRLVPSYKIRSASQQLKLTSL